MACVYCYSDISQGGVFGFTAAVGNDAGIASAFSSFNSVEGFGQGTDLVNLDQNGIANTLLDAFNQTLFVGYKEVVANQLYLFTQLLGELLPAFPIVLGHAVFDGDDGIFSAQICQIINHFITGLYEAFACQIIFAILIELAAGNVQSNHNILTGFIACFFHSLQNYINSFSIAAQVGSKAALITQSSAKALGFQKCLQVMINLCVHAQAFAKGFCTYGHNHELLDIHVVISVLTTVQNVHHGHGQLLRSYAAKIQVQGQTYGRSSGFSHSHGYTQNSICAQTALVRSAIQTNQQLVDFGLSSCFQANNSFCDDVVNIVNCFGNTLAHVAFSITITQLHSLVYTGGCTGGNSSATNSAILQANLNLYGRIAARVQNLTSIYFSNHCHL